MKELLNEVVDKHNQSYKLYLEIDRSSIDGYADIRFYSTYSGSKNPESEQTKWKTTIPYDSIDKIVQGLNSFTR